MATIATLHRILRQYKTIAMVGLSNSPHRPSYFAAKYMLHHGYRVIPVNPRYEQVLDQTCYPSIPDIPDPIDIVDCFRKPDEIPLLTEQAIAAGAKCLWLQLGIEHTDSEQKARDAGLDVVSNRCVKIEHGRLFGGLNFA
ncbi:MAG: CoA-binding protein, partial [Pseudomonadota bacterium]